MITFFTTILCLNIDALSYGISNGIAKKIIPLKFIFFISILSTIMFAIPLAISKYIYEYFNELVLRLINAVFLIVLGLSYMLKKQDKTQTKKQVDFSLKSCFFECVAISVDAIFTAILSGFSANYYIYSLLFYIFTNFFAIFLGNNIFYYFNKNIKINLSFFSGFIFIVLGILKIIGF